VLPFLPESKSKNKGSEASSRFDDDPDEVVQHEANPNKDDTSSRGLFLSPAMANLLRLSAGSESEKQTAVLEKILVPRRGSDSEVNTTLNSKRVNCIQTKSATETAAHNNAHNATTDQRVQRRPFDVLTKILKEQGVPTLTRPAQSLKDFWFPRNTVGYTKELTVAVRNDDLATIRHLHESKSHNLQCSNKFGESIVHTAARRGTCDILRYMVQIAGVSVRVCCDSGRNPLHDACWTGSPNFELVVLLLKECPDFLLLADTRGYTPLQYAPKETWEEWAVFLRENSGLLLPQILSKLVVAAN
jgi:ankyrin repeat protein